MPLPAVRACNTGLSCALAVLGCLCVDAFAPRPAHAFSDPLTFTDPVEIGGGGGRFFTGSPADGYSCDVCHEGAASVPLEILGLPLSGYRPETAYEVRVEWPATLAHMGLALEITDASGLNAGTLRLPPASELPEPERCEPVEDGVMAGALSELEAGRTILSVTDCGAKRVRFLWTTPAESRGTLRLSGGFVASDGEADALGDGSTIFARALAPASGFEAVASELRAGCGVVPGAERGASAWPWLAVALALLGLRRRRPAVKRQRRHGQC